MPVAVLDARDARVLFGVGALSELGSELRRLNLSRALVLCTPGRRALVKQLADAAGEVVVGSWDGAREHVPKPIVEEAVAQARALRADSVIALGGGSATGLAKAVAASEPISIAAVPTTYSGSELTDIYAVSDSGSKRTARSDRVRPRLVLYDPSLTLDLPPNVSATSGGNALAHCVEALWISEAPEEIANLAEAGCRELADALPDVVSRPRDIDARTRALRGAYLGGRALEAGIALHHKLCHLLGGRFGMPHAQTHTALLPHVAAYHRDYAPAAMERLSRALGTSDAPLGLYDLVVRLGAATGLKDLGLAESDLDAVADRAALLDLPLNPRRPDRESLRRLLEAAWRGERPPPRFAHH